MEEQTLQWLHVLLVISNKQQLTTLLSRPVPVSAMHTTSLPGRALQQADHVITVYTHKTDILHLHFTQTKTLYCKCYQ